VYNNPARPKKKTWKMPNPAGEGKNQQGPPRPLEKKRIHESQYRPQYKTTSHSLPVAGATYRSPCQNSLIV